MELGGNILLQGFSEDPADIVVLKKIIGNFAKNVSSDQELEKLTLTCEEGTGEYTISGILLLKGKEVTASSTKSNLYFCLDGVLKELSEALVT